jgi:hypothetical protein
MLTIERAYNPVYLTEDGTSIDLMVKFVEMDTVLPFTATPIDPMPYGKQLYDNALMGEYGPIAPYVPRSQPVAEGTQTL